MTRRLSPAARLLVAASVLSIFLALPAAAQNVLWGDWFLVDTMGCAATDAFGDGGGDLVIVNDGDGSDYLVEGLLRYRPNGTGRLIGKLIRLQQGRLEPGDAPVSEEDLRCVLRYEMLSRRVFEQRMTCRTVPRSGSDAGLVTTITGIVQRGRIAGDTVLLSDTSSNVERVENELASSQRVCGTTGQAARR